MSASNEMMAKSIAMLAKSESDTNNKSMVEKIYEKTALIPFKAKYPTQSREACDYLYQVYLHETRNKQLSAQTVYRSVMTTMPDHTRALFSDWLGMRALADIPQAESKSTPSLANFTQFVLDQFNVSADRHTLDTWANTISFRDNEDPATWVQHARTLQRKANMYLVFSQGETEATRILRFDDAWVLKLMVRKIIHEANTDEYLNRKVMEKMCASSKLKSIIANCGPSSPSTATAELALFESVARGVRKKIMHSRVFENKQKTQFKNYASSGVVTFNQYLKEQYTAISGEPNIEKLVNEEPCAKKRKLNNGDAKESENGTCRQGDRCRWFIKSGHCKFQHTAAELKILEALYEETESERKMASKAYTGSSKESEDLGRRSTDKCPAGQWCSKIGSNDCRMWHPPCDRGVKCNFWQGARCRFAHDEAKMQCTRCEGNHRGMNCNQKSGDNSEPSKDGFKRYSGKQYFTKKGEAVAPRADKVLLLNKKFATLSDAEAHGQYQRALEILAVAKER